MALPAAVLSASARLTTRPGIVVGWHLRDAAGSAGGESAQVDLDASSANPAAANNLVLAAAAGRTTYITGFEVTGLGATAAAAITVTVTGVLGGTKAYFLFIPAGAGTPTSNRLEAIRAIVIGVLSSWLTREIKAILSRSTFWSSA